MPAVGMPLRAYPIAYIDLAFTRNESLKLELKTDPHAGRFSQRELGADPQPALLRQDLPSPTRVTRKYIIIS